MFRGLFKGNKKEKEDYFETVDPVVEQRRKEKFSTPLIYDDFEEEKKKEVIVEKQTKKIIPEKKEEDLEVLKASYQPMEVISPMRGVTNKTVSKTATSKPKKKDKKRSYEEQLIPVISPYFGNFDEQEEIEDAVLKPVEEKNKDKNTNEQTDPAEAHIEEQAYQSVPITVEENLRNIAKIVEEEQNQLKIIEERTGEFKLDFSGTNDTSSSLIDEIDDNMSLDELMSLYEKKFTD